jgi:hypothetical protein
MSLMVQPAERIMKDPRAKVVHNERKGDIVAFWKLVASNSMGRRSVVVVLDTISSSMRDADDVEIVGSSMFDDVDNEE